MTYAIFDSTGNLVDAFDDRDAAVAAMSKIVHAEPEAAADVALLTFDADGQPVRDALPGSALLTETETSTA